LPRHVLEQSITYADHAMIRSDDLATSSVTMVPSDNNHRRIETRLRLLEGSWLLSVKKGRRPQCERRLF
jgi:hypothetical protein